MRFKAFGWLCSLEALRSIVKGAGVGAYGREEGRDCDLK